MASYFWMKNLYHNICYSNLTRCTSKKSFKPYVLALDNIQVVTSYQTKICVTVQLMFENIAIVVRNTCYQELGHSYENYYL